MHTDQFGGRLRQWRGDQTQAAAAALLGIQQSYLSRLEAGLRRPTVETLAHLAASYGIGAEALGEAVRGLASTAPPEAAAVLAAAVCAVADGHRARVNAASRAVR